MYNKMKLLLKVHMKTVSKRLMLSGQTEAKLVSYILLWGHSRFVSKKKCINFAAERSVYLRSGLPGRQIWSSIPVKNQSRSQHSTWLEKDHHLVLQFNFVVIVAIVLTIDVSFKSVSTTLNYVDQHSSLLVNIASKTCAIRERWTLNHQVGCTVTKGVPIPP